MKRANTHSINEFLALNLREQMRRQKLTQQALSRVSGVAQATISLYLNPQNRKSGRHGGEPSANLAAVGLLANALGCQIQDLIEPSTVPNMPSDSVATAVPMNPHETLAERVRFSRELAGMTQEELALVAGMKQPDISKIERGLILKTTGIARLSSVLDVSAEWLELGTGEPSRQVRSVEIGSATQDDYGSRLALAMKEKGVGIADLARELGLSYQAVRKVVRGDSGAFNTVNHLAAARLLEVSPDWLATGKSTVSETLRVNDTLMRSEPIDTHAAAPALPRSINQVLADNLRAQMTRKGMTQQALSKASRVAQATISLYLNPDNRKPNASGKEPSAKLSEIQRLAAALRCSALDLLQDNETLTREPEPIAPQSRAFASHHPLDDPLTVASIIADRYADDKQRLIAFKLINETREWMRQIEAAKRADAELNSKVKNTDQ